MLILVYGYFVFVVALNDSRRMLSDFWLLANAGGGSDEQEYLQNNIKTDKIC